MEKDKILIVEDDYDTLMFLNLFLRKRFMIESCRTDGGFDDLIKKSRYDLIIMDIAIKGNRDGLQLTRELKSSDSYKDIPVLCLTAHVMEQDKQNAFEAGVDYFLPKPVTNSILMNTIVSLLETKHARVS